MNKPLRSVIWVVVLLSFNALASDLPIKGLAHVAFQSTNLERSRAFYTGFTGFEFAFAVSEKHEGWYFKVNDEQFVKLVFKPNQHIQDKLIEIAVQVASVNKTYEALKSKGLEPSKVKQRHDGTLATTVRDPEGHVIAFVEYTNDSLQVKTQTKHLGARRIADALVRASISLSNQETLSFYTEKLGLKQTWQGVWAHDDKSHSGFLKLSDQSEDVLEYVFVKEKPTGEDFNVLHHAVFSTENVAEIYEETGKYGRPRLDKYAIQTNALDTPFFNLYCTDGIRLEFTQAK